MENKKGSISEKFLIGIVCLIIFWEGINVYASINGYGNAFTIVKNIISNNAKEKNEIVTNEIGDSLEPISEEELKEYLEYYVILNSYDIFLEGTGEATRKEWQNMMKVQIAMEFIYNAEEANNAEIKYDIKKVNKVLKELCGEEASGVLNLPKDGAIFYNNYEKVYENEPGDFYISGLCLNIENLKYNDGIYEVKFTYCYPSEENYIFDNIDKLAVYETTLKFKINDEYKYAKYCLIDSDKIEYKKIKDSEIEEEEYYYDKFEIDENIVNTINEDESYIQDEPPIIKLSTEEILTNLKIYFGNVNNSKEDVKVIFRKYEKGDTVEDIEYNTLLLNWFIGKINDNIESIDNTTTYAQWCNRDQTKIPKEEYLMMFMYDSHQTQITWNLENENQIVISWYNDKLDIIEIDKIELTKSAKEIFEELMTKCKNN